MSDKNKLIESQLFDWTGGLDQYEAAIFGFYDVTLKVAIGEFPVGSTFDSVTVGYENSTITLHRGDEEWKYQLNLQVSSLLNHTVHC